MTLLLLKVILAGKKETVTLAMQKADRFRTELLRRGVLLVPVVWGERKTQEIDKKKKGFGASSSKAAATSLPSIGVTERFSIFLEQTSRNILISDFFFIF